MRLRGLRKPPLPAAVEQRGTSRQLTSRLRPKASKGTRRTEQDARSRVAMVTSRSDTYRQQPGLRATSAPRTPSSSPRPSPARRELEKAKGLDRIDKDVQKNYALTHHVRAVMSGPSRRGWRHRRERDRHSLTGWNVGQPGAVREQKQTGGQVPAAETQSPVLSGRAVVEIDVGGGSTRGVCR